MYALASLFMLGEIEELSRRAAAAARARGRIAATSSWPPTSASATSRTRSGSPRTTPRRPARRSRTRWPCAARTCSTTARSGCVERGATSPCTRARGWRPPLPSTRAGAGRPGSWTSIPRRGSSSAFSPARAAASPWPPLPPRPRTALRTSIRPSATHEICKASTHPGAMRWLCSCRAEPPPPADVVTARWPRSRRPPPGSPPSTWPCSRRRRADAGASSSAARTAAPSWPKPMPGWRPESIKRPDRMTRMLAPGAWRADAT